MGAWRVVVSSALNSQKGRWGFPESRSRTPPPAGAPPHGLGAQGSVNHTRGLAHAGAAGRATLQFVVGQQEAQRLPEPGCRHR